MSSLRTKFERIELFIKELIERNDGELDLENNSYFLVFNDGMFSIFKDDETGEIKTKINYMNNKQTKVSLLDDSLSRYVDVETLT